MYALIPLAYTYPKSETVRSYGNCMCNYKKLTGLQCILNEGMQWRQAGLYMCTWAACQENMKTWVTGLREKRRDAGFLLPLANKGTQRSCSRSKKRQARGRNPSWQPCQPSCPLLVCLEAVPQHGCFLLEFTDPSIYGSLFALSLQGSLLCFFPSGTLSLTGSLLGVRGLPLLSDFYPCGAHPKLLKVAL